MRLRVCQILGVLALVASLPVVPAHASSIQLLTGVNASNAVLPDLTTDPFWSISVDGRTTFTSAKTVSAPIWLTCGCGLDTVGSEAKWISDPSTNGSNPSDAWPVDPTVYADRTFDLTGFDLSTVALSGIWRVADDRLGIYVNGHLIDPATANGAFGFSADQAFALGAGSGFFTSGVNTLELRGSSVNSIWDGFWLDARISGTPIAGSPVPEPASLMLLGTGVIGLIARRRKGRRSVE